MFVYLIKNCANGKLYIGKTIQSNLQKYLQTKISSAKRGRYNGRSYLFNAMKKWGPSVWSIEPLISSLTTEWQLCLWEIALIYAFGSTNPEVGYNLCRGGEGHGVTFSQETLAKLSKIRKQMWSDPQFRVKRAESLKEAMSKSEYHASLSEGQQKRWSDPQLRAEKSKEMIQSWADPDARGKKLIALREAWGNPQVQSNHIAGATSPTARARFSKAMKIKWATPEIRAKLTEANRKKGVANRLKNSDEQKERWADPEYRANLCQALKKRASDPEVKARRSALSKKMWADPEYRTKQSEAHRNKLPLASSEVQLQCGGL